MKRRKQIPKTSGHVPQGQRPPGHRPNGRQHSDRHLPDPFAAAAERFSPPPRSQPDFYARVYAVVEQIPCGKVTTYGAIAEVLGRKGSARLVGQALTALPECDIPAHRVINRFGALTGAIHFGGYDRMRSLLTHEGVRFVQELVDMNTYFWDPRERPAPEE